MREGRLGGREVVSTHVQLQLFQQGSNYGYVVRKAIKIFFTHTYGYGKWVQSRAFQ